MATADQLRVAERGGGRYRMSKRLTLTTASGLLGVTGNGSITGGSGGTVDGVYPLAFTGGTLATGGAPATGTFTVASGAVSAITLTSPGAYTAAPSFSFAACAGLSGASASVTTAIMAAASWTPPPGTAIHEIKTFTPTAFTGSPTNMNLTVGSEYLGAEYVATVDVKGQGVISNTLVGAGLAALLNMTGTIWAQVINNAGTNPVGTAMVEILYAPPNP